MPSRRSVVAALALGLAGCSANPGSSSTATGTDGDTPTTSTEAPTTAEPTPTTGTSPTDERTDTGGTPEPSAEPPSGPAVRWTAALGGPVSERPAIGDGLLYVAGGRNDRGDPPDQRSVAEPESSQNLYAFSLDGIEQWRYEAPAGVGEPVLADEGVYTVVGWDGGLTGVNQRVARVADGDRQFETDPTDDWLSILGVGDGAVFAGTGDDGRGISGEEIFAVEADGTERWRVEAGDASDGVISDGTLIVPFADRQTVAFDTATGSRRWEFPAGTASGEPQVFDGTIYLDSPEQNDDGDYPLISVRASDGTERWRYAAEGGDQGPFVVTGAVQANGTVFGTEYGGLLFAVDAADGTERWRYTVDANTTTEPVVHSETVYLVTNGSTIHAVDATNGERRWQQSVSGRLHGVLVSDEAILAPAGRNSGGSYRAFSHDGDELWTFDHGGNLARPILDGQRAYVGTEGGHFACLGP